MTLTLQRSNTLLDKSITAGGESRMSETQTRKYAIPLFLISGWQQTGIRTTGSVEM